ncbi:MAG: shikimate kinase [Deltaproteobacteria bacterium]|nr:shikimate kinase [Deltaproteobacteria bacterium]
MAGTIWLVGMMGAGKSAVGEALAAKLGIPFLDTDAEIEHGAGLSIPKIFEAEGEAGFRARERGVIAGLAGKRAVISLGGGAIAQPGQAEALAAGGTVVYLRATVETLVTRIGQDDYETASLVIDTDGREIEALAAELAKQLKDAA